MRTLRIYKNRHRDADSLAILRPRIPIQTLAIVLGAVASLNSPCQSQDRFAEKQSPHPSLFDVTDYAKRAEEENHRWRAFLKRIKEPDLESLKGNEAITIYRFIYRPHFSKTLILTAKKEGDAFSFEIRRLSEKETDELKGSINLDAHTFEAIKRIFSAPDVFNPIGHLTPQQSEALWGLDGAWWHLEILTDRKLTHSKIWSPETIRTASKEDKKLFHSQSGFELPNLQPFEEACLHLVRLSGLPLDALNYDP